MIIETEEYLSIHEAAEMVGHGISPQALQHFIVKGRIENIIRFKGRVYIHIDAIPIFREEYAMVRKPRKGKRP